MNRALSLLSSSWASHSCTRVMLLGLLPAFFVLPVKAQDSLIVEFPKTGSASAGPAILYNEKEIFNIHYSIFNVQRQASGFHPPAFGPSADTLTRQQKNRRIKIIAGANIAGYSAAMLGLYHAWYKDYPQGKFHTFNDIGEWQQMDKLGHVYSAYAESKASMELWRWTGIDRKKRIWIGGMSGAIYQTTIEVLDGFSTEWGWSWGDFAANIAGSGMLVAQELAWDRQRIQMKWSFHRKRYNDPMLNERSNELFGKSNPERFLKDYNGQTYWFSATLKDFFPKSKLPAWLQLSVGTGAEGMFGGYENLAYDDLGNIKFDRRDLKRYRQWYLAPDIDLTRIKTNKKGIRMALYVLNIFKFPTPSLELSRGKLSWNWLHF